MLELRPRRADNRLARARLVNQRFLGSVMERSDKKLSASYQRIYRMVGKIPRGKVATYGQIAALAGMPRHARQVGYALHALTQNSRVPWQRVINSKGEISVRTWSENHLLQRILLEDEGVQFDHHGRVSLTRFQWTPKS
jgi:methylated-DNA-protein-cysteine methyltransferase related protein